MNIYNDNRIINIQLSQWGVIAYNDYSKRILGTLWNNPKKPKEEFHDKLYPTTMKIPIHEFLTIFGSYSGNYNSVTKGNLLFERIWMDDKESPYHLTPSEIEDIKVLEEGKQNDG